MAIGINHITEEYGYFIDKVPQEVLNDLKIPIEKLKDNFNLGRKFNNYLAGEIQHEYEIPISPVVINYIKKISGQLDSEIKYLSKNYYDKITNIFCSNLWVNFQQKHEYNPVHYHNGTFSFVIWYQIPYTFEEESKYSSKKIEDCTHGHFQFLHSNPFNKNSDIMCLKIDSDKKIEGYAAIFPSTLNHIVYPFYSSDDYRITVSGNVHVKTEF